MDLGFYSSHGYPKTQKAVGHVYKYTKVYLTIETKARKWKYVSQWGDSPQSAASPQTAS